ncbi:hypothetical protein [Sphingopyxis macrogoltabida]|uniref:Uncharacterized protein n=1 Tax=Sphingopyxis macrogoltabida TaxID=33050 RepID=A0AAC9AWX1_SPHMC|nr:hypothetical protein [Sphingopyxis macrogoltabida]ALJ14928.1 hypothetical protein LH19_18820 [Sphingopyxis macrogoltabida]AMU91179.1 hypothetical protein ATM17_19380 [Sphingopyxis macrogoltabida]
MTTEVPAASWRKLALQSLFGALAGAGAMIAAMTLLEGELPVWQKSQIILVGVGMIYVLMGLFVGLGVLAPRLLGQRMLNVADAEEIVEERGNLGASALSCTAIGAALVLLAYATVEGANAPVTASTAYWILLALLVAGTAIMLPMWRNFDELWRQLAVDASALAGNILMTMCFAWGGAAAAGLVAAPHPLDLVSAAFGIFLLATFIAVGRRGMMMPS